MPFLTGTNTPFEEVWDDLGLQYRHEGYYTAYSISIIVFPFIATTTFFASRLYVRVRQRNFGPEDWLMLFAWICLVVVLGVYLGYETSDLGKNLVTLVDDLNGTIPAFRKTCNVTIYVFSMLNAWFAKLSIVCMLLEHIAPRLGGQGRMCITIWVIFGFYSLFTLAILIAGGVSASLNGTFVASYPSVLYWEPTDLNDSIDAWRQYRSPWTSEMAVLLSWSLFSGIQDIIYATIGLLSLRIRERTTNQKIASIVLFLLGVTAGVFVAIRGGWAWYASPRIWFTADFNNFDWVMNEGYVLMACGNLPRLLPLWDRLVRGKRFEAMPTTFLGDVERRREVVVEEYARGPKGPLQPLEPEEQLATMPIRYNCAHELG